MRAARVRDGALRVNRSRCLRTSSSWAYVLASGALWGIATFGYTETPSGPDTTTVWAWAGMLVVGLLLLVDKDRRISYPGLRARIAAGDLLSMQPPGWIPASSPR